MGKKKTGVHKENNGTWTISTRIKLMNGSIKYIKKRGFRTEFLALSEKNKILNSRYNTDVFNDKYIRTWVDYYLIFLENTIKITSLKTKKYLLYNHIVKKYGDELITDFVSEVYLKDIVESIETYDFTIRYKNRIIKEISNFILYLSNNNLINREEYKRTQLILKQFYNNKPTMKNEIKIWTKNDCRKFLDSINRKSMDYIIFSLWCQTGVRIGEIRGLQIKHFNFDLKTVRIEQQATEKTNAGHSVIVSPKSKSSIRTILLTDEIVEDLKKYINELNLKEEDFVFHGSNTNKPLGENTVRRLMIKYCKLSGVEYIKPHGIRHSNTTWLLSGNLSLEQVALVSERLGHRDKSTTLNIYYHINKSSQKDIINLLDF